MVDREWLNKVTEKHPCLWRQRKCNDAISRRLETTCDNIWTCLSTFVRTALSPSRGQPTLHKETTVLNKSVNYSLLPGWCSKSAMNSHILRLTTSSCHKINLYTRGKWPLFRFSWFLFFFFSVTSYSFRGALLHSSKASGRFVKRSFPRLGWKVNYFARDL